jgi:hypothetical protein
MALKESKLLPSLGYSDLVSPVRWKRKTDLSWPHEFSRAPATAHLKEAGVICKIPIKSTGFDNLISHSTVAPESKYAVT